MESYTIMASHVWLLSLHIVVSRSIYAVAVVRVSLRFTARSYSIHG